MTVKIETDSQPVFQSDNKYSHIRRQDCEDCDDCKDCKDCKPADNDGFVICFSSVFLFCSIAPPGN